MPVKKSRARTTAERQRSRMTAPGRTAKRGRPPRSPEDVALARMFALRVQAIRARSPYAGLSDRAFAAEIGVPYETTRTWLVKHSRHEPPTPSAAHLATITTRTNVPLDWLLGIVGEGGEPQVRSISTTEDGGPGTVAQLEHALAAYVAQRLDEAQRTGALPRVLGLFARQSRMGPLPVVGRGCFMAWQVDGAAALAAAVAREIASAKVHARQLDEAAEAAALLRALPSAGAPSTPVTRRLVDFLERIKDTHTDAAWDGKGSALLVPASLFGGPAPPDTERT